jgi:phage shock protein PspC (stress-responsive transcriptional regulator)
MIRLAIAVGFLAVFGIVVYIIVLLMTDFFSNKNNPNKNQPLL